MLADREICKAVVNREQTTREASHVGPLGACRPGGHTKDGITHYQAQALSG